MLLSALKKSLKLFFPQNEPYHVLPSAEAPIPRVTTSTEANGEFFQVR